MITADDLDKLCVITTRIVQGDTHGFTTEDWDFIDEVTVHAEDVLASAHNETDDEPDLNDWTDEFFDESYSEDYDEELDPYDPGYDD